MNILFLTLSYPEFPESNIYSDLMEEICRMGHKVVVVCSRERRQGKPTEYFEKQDVKVLRVKTGNFKKTNIIEKVITTLRIDTDFIQEIQKYLSNEEFDMVIYSTPPITFAKVVQFIKKKHNCISYLLLKDIFPQNAVDLGMMNKNGLIWKYFRTKEKNLYAISDYIGCMSPANVKYIIKHNQEISLDKVEECPNSIKPKPILQLKTDCQNKLRCLYGIPTEAVIFIYGGNLGKPQGIDFLCKVIDSIKGREDVFFLIIGSGTEYNRIENFLRQQGYKNSRLIDRLPKEDFDQLISICDVGLIFLHPKFTIPNFPSRLLAYMEAAIPIVAATDVNTDIKDILEESGSGFWVESGDLDGFIECMNRIIADSDLRQRMGIAGRMYLEKYYTVARSCAIIMAHLEKKQLTGAKDS